MYTIGNIIYFTPFYFPNGKSAPKNKYFIVLHCEGDEVVVASLPTSVDTVPSYTETKHGCIELPDANFNCYHFPKDHPITDDDWYFDLPTFVHGTQIGTFELKIFNGIYKVEDKDYEIIGELKKEELIALLTCFATSKSVKTKYKHYFSTRLTQL